MVSATHQQPFDMDYDVTFRKSRAPGGEREVCSKDRYHTRARYRRTRSRSGISGAHRRRNKRCEL